jgi:hypothetical protein
MVCYYTHNLIALSLSLSIYVSSFFLFCDVYSICLALCVCVKNRRRTRAVVEDHMRTEYSYSYFFWSTSGGLCLNVQCVEYKIKYILITIILCGVIIIQVSSDQGIVCVLVVC